MYKDEYKRWLELANDPEIQQELLSIQSDDEQIKERFLLNLEFGTGGLRGVLGAGTYRMNIYTVAKCTQGLANYLLQEFSQPKVAISYDSRIKSDVFAKISACVLAASGVKVYLYKTLMPTPMLSYAVRAYSADAGIMVTASHNPAKYNGYKVYGNDGCQMTSESADKVLENINKIDIFNDVNMIDFDEAISQGKIEYITESVVEEYYTWCLGQMMRKDVFEKAPLKVVYTPLNGTGNVPVRHVLSKAGLKDIIVVKEQEMPDGNFPTCPYPNPEIKQAMSLGLELATKENADILIATDPDADRVGIAVKENNELVMLTGNQVGILLVDYIARTRKELNNMPKQPIIVKSIVTSSLADEVAKSYGIETVNVLTGFKYIGEVIKNLEAEDKKENFVFGFEESYGYLVGTAVRDKDAVVASLLISEMAAYYKSQNLSISKALNDIYEKFGYYLNVVDSYEFEGLVGMDKMKNIMDNLRKDCPESISGFKIETVEDYLSLTRTCLDTKIEDEIKLPKSNILVYNLEGGHQIIIRPSGTEPKIKVYFSIKAESFNKTQQIKDIIDEFIKPLMK